MFRGFSDGAWPQDCGSANEGAAAALAAAVRRRPHCVAMGSDPSQKHHTEVLIDEADKAAPDFLAILLEVIEVPKTALKERFIEYIIYEIFNIS